MAEWTEPIARFGAVRSTETAPYAQPSGTQDDLPTPARRPDSNEPPGLAEWLASSEARELEGRWVLLTDDFNVVDSAETPSELLDAHPEDRTPFVVYVDPSNVNLAV